MPFPLIFIAGLVGWWPPSPIPRPEPVPKEDFIKNAIFGFLGGAGGGWLMCEVFDLAAPMQSVDLILVLIGAAAMGKIFQFTVDTFWHS